MVYKWTQNEVLASSVQNIYKWTQNEVLASFVQNIYYVLLMRIIHLGVDNYFLPLFKGFTILYTYCSYICEQSY